MRIGRYELFDRIGIGGMAEVFRARAYGAEGFQKNVVLKRILPHLSHDAEFKSMFVDEAKITVALQHANIVQVLDLGQIDEQLFIAMELVEGTDLGRLMDALKKRGEVLSLHDALYITIETLKGLHHAHTSHDAQGRPLVVVHRDVSPSNVLISHAGEVKIGDFGIATAARRSTQRTQQGIVKGKLRYMSVEQLENIQVDGRADVYSMGRVVLQMLTGKAPFSGMKERDIITAIRGGDFPRVEELVPSIDVELAAILNRATAHLRQDRYQSAEEFQEALHDFAFSRGLKLSPRPLKERLARVFPQNAAPTRPEDVSLGVITGTVIADGVSEEGVTTLRTHSVVDGKAARPQPSQRGPSTRVWEEPKPRRWRTPLIVLGALVLLSVAAVVAYPYLPLDPSTTPLPGSSPQAAVSASPTPAGGQMATGLLSFDVKPWAEVKINGKRVGVTPIKALELPVGTHELSYETPDGKTHQIPVKIRKGRTTTIER